MPTRELDIHPEALQEAEADIAFYASRSASVGARLLDEFEGAVARILDAPERWHPYVCGTRRYILRKFPYSIVYRSFGRRVTIYAFAHAMRRPGYWRRRLR